MLVLYVVKNHNIQFVHEINVREKKRTEQSRNRKGNIRHKTQNEDKQNTHKKIHNTKIKKMSNTVPPTYRR